MDTGRLRKITYVLGWLQSVILSRLYFLVRLSSFPFFFRFTHFFNGCLFWNYQSIFFWIYISPIKKHFIQSGSFLCCFYFFRFSICPMVVEHWLDCCVFLFKNRQFIMWTDINYLKYENIANSISKESLWSNNSK